MTSFETITTPFSLPFSPTKKQLLSTNPTPHPCNRPGEAPLCVLPRGEVAPEDQGEPPLEDLGPGGRGRVCVGRRGRRKA